MALSFTTDHTTVPSISFLVTSGGLIWYNLPKSLKNGWSYVRWVPHCTTLSSVWSLLPLDTCQGHATRNHSGSGVCCILYACRMVPSPCKPMGSGRLVDGATRVTEGKARSSEANRRPLARSAIKDKSKPGPESKLPSPFTSSLRAHYDRTHTAAYARTTIMMMMFSRPLTSLQPCLWS